eukprot:Hpha_TRINITY_DN4900_c0_g1::TRINITY_DN4900_c0_g1_i1::g.51412::m.51412
MHRSGEAGGRAGYSRSAAPPVATQCPLKDPASPAAAAASRQTPPSSPGSGTSGQPGRSPVTGVPGNTPATPAQPVSVSRRCESGSATERTPPITPRGPQTFKKYKPGPITLSPQVVGSTTQTKHFVDEALGVFRITNGTGQVFEATRDGVQSKNRFLLINHSDALAPGMSPIEYSSEPFDQRRIRYEDLEEGGQIGKGHSSTVFQCRHRLRGRFFAMKQISLDWAMPGQGGVHKGSAEGGAGAVRLQNAVVRELQVLHDNLNCDYILKYYDAFFRDGSLKIVLEFMHYGTLQDIVVRLGQLGREGRPPAHSTQHSPTQQGEAAYPEEPLAVGAPLPEGMCMVIARHVALGLAYIHGHQHPRVHRDIKPSNLLVNSRGVVKICDFGISVEAGRAGQVDDTPEEGTFAYMAPERFKRKVHGAPADIWSLGVTLAFCGLGKYPFEGRSEGPFDHAELIEEPVVFPESLGLSVMFTVLVGNCMRSAPDQRPTASQMAALSRVARAEEAFDVTAFLSERLGEGIDHDALEQVAGEQPPPRSWGRGARVAASAHSAESPSRSFSSPAASSGSSRPLPQGRLPAGAPPGGSPGVGGR